MNIITLKTLGTIEYLQKLLLKLLEKRVINCRNHEYGFVFLFECGDSSLYFLNIPHIRLCEYNHFFLIGKFWCVRRKLFSHRSIRFQRTCFFNRNAVKEQFGASDMAKESRTQT